MLTYLIIAVTAVVSFIGFRNRKFFYALSLNPWSVFRKKQWYRIVTHAFVHGDLTHLLVNMLVFWSFGANIERIFALLAAQGAIGNAQTAFLMLYFGGVIFSALPDLIRQRKNPYYNSIGASGAVSSVLFASIFFNPWGMIYFMAVVPIPSIVFGVAYLWYESYMQRRAKDNVNHLAHIWGAVYGVVFLILLNPLFLRHFIKALTDFNLF